MTFGNYDFGLTSEQESRAAKLHAESIVIDMLYWGPVTYQSHTDEMLAEQQERWSKAPSDGMAHYTVIDNMIEHLHDPAFGFEEAWRASGVTAGSQDITLTSQEVLISTIGYEQVKFDTFPWLRKALRAQDIRDAHADGGHAGWINTQHVGELRVEHLSGYYNYGMRMLMPTYNAMNHLAAGCTDRSNAGISNIGAGVVTRMNELGMILDTSHCGKQTTLDACELSSAPVIASHSCAQGVFNHDRGKSDEELIALANTGGLCGVVTVPFFLGEGRDVSIETMLDHIDYMVKLVGAEHVGIGTDWPMMYPKWAVTKVFSPTALLGIGFRPEHQIDPAQNMIGFDDYRDFPNITRGLVSRGYSDADIKAILGENFMRVFEKVCG